MLLNRGNAVGCVIHIRVTFSGAPLCTSTMPPHQLQCVTHLNADTFPAEVKKARARKKPLSVPEPNRLNTAHAATIVPLQAHDAEARTLDSPLSALVRTPQVVTPDEIKLMWDTAPPRMPS